MAKEKSKKDFKKIEKEEKKKQQQDEEETNKKVVLLIIIALIAIVGLIIGGTIYFNSKDDDGKNKAKEKIKEKKIVKGKTLEVVDGSTKYVAMLDEISPRISITGDTYQTRVIKATINATDNEQLESVEYGFSNSDTIVPTYHKTLTNMKKITKNVSYDTKTNNYKETYLWVKSTDKEGNVSVSKKLFITAEFVNNVPVNTQVTGDVIINDAGTALSNVTVKGNIYITKNVGLGDVTLNNVTVEKNIYVNGGGTNSIHIDKVNVKSRIIVDNQNHVRLNFKNLTQNIKVDLKTDTTIQTDETSASKVNTTVYNKIKVLVDGNIKEMTVKGDATVLAREDGKEVNEKSTIDTVNISSTASKAVVDTYVKNTNYNVDTHKDARVQPLATLELTVNYNKKQLKTVEPTPVVASVTTELTLNREINVTENLDVTDEAISNLVRLLKNGNYTQSELREAVNAVGQNDIIVVISYKNDGEQVQSISSAQRGEVVKESDGNAPDKGKYEKEVVYQNETPVTVETEVEEATTTVVVIEKGNAYIKEEEATQPVDAPVID